MIPRFVPYDGGNVDQESPGNPIPYIWDVVIPGDLLFVNTTKKAILPHSESLRKCHECDGLGWVQDSICETCRGSKILKHYTAFTSVIENHSENIYFGKGFLSKTMMKKATGQVIFQEEGLEIDPLPLDFPDFSVAQKSIEILNQHKFLFKFTCFVRIIKQKHSVEKIPVTIVGYSNRNVQNGHFIIYGNENHLEFIDYPFKCNLCTIC